MPIVGGLDVGQPTHPFTGGLVQRFVPDPKRLCTARVNVVSIGDQKDVIINPGFKNAVNQTGFTGEQKAWKVSHEQRKIREPFFNRSEGARGAFGAGE